MRYSTTRATPRNMRYALCDMCQFKFHIKDLTRVTNKDSRKYGMLLCARDFKYSLPHPQDKPKIVKEVILENTDKMRPQSEDTQYITNGNDDRLPGTPSDGHVYTDPFDNSLMLRWSAPQDQGSSPVLYYVIQYAVPQRINYTTLTSNSGTNATYYEDTVNTSTTHVSYKVAAVNGFGQGAFSDEFFYPVDDYADVFTYGTTVLLTGDLDYITLGTGQPILVS